MRKQILNDEAGSVSGASWLDLERLAQVEITSEDPARPVEGALVPGNGTGWRAAVPGSQIIRLVFDVPQQLKRIYVVFDEADRERTQEIVVLWLPHGESSYREVVRQQFNFSPPATVREVEDYHVELTAVSALELRIVPDLGTGDAVASLRQLRLA